MEIAFADAPPGIGGSREQERKLTFLQSSMRRVFGADRRLRGLLRGSALVMAIQVFGIGLAYAMQVLVARRAGAFQFGLFAYAWTWMNLVFLVAPFGLNELVLCLIPSYATRGQWPLLRGLLVRAPMLVLCLAGVAGSVAVGVLLLLGDRLGDHYRLPLLLTFVATPLFGLLAFLQGVGRAFGGACLAFLPRLIGLPGAVLLTVGGFALAGKTPDAIHILVVTVAATAALVGVQAMLLARAMPTEAKRCIAKGATRDWLAQAMPLLFITLCFGLLTHCDLLIVGLFLSAEDVAIYQAASRTAALISFPLFALNALVAPMIARLHAEDRLRDLEHSVSIATQAVFWPSVGLALLAILGSRYILGVFGTSFEAGQVVLTILVLGHLVNVGTGPVSYLMTMTGHHGSCAVVWGSTVAAQLALNLLLIPKLGTVGAATGTTLATCFATLSLTILVKRRLNVSAHALVALRATLAKAIRV